MYMIGQLRFCYECMHRRKVDALAMGEYRCQIHQELKIFDSTEASQCIISGDFVEIKNQFRGFNFTNNER